jgi:hypothetical protein
MVFTGDWNGGERKFRLGSGQRLTLDRIVRLDPEGGSRQGPRRGKSRRGRPLRLGLLQTRCAGGAACPPIRRSTAPSSDYRLDYRITGALRRTGEQSYRLDHQFAFTERDGVIERLVVRLALAPEWRGEWAAGLLGAGAARTRARASSSPPTFLRRAVLPANAVPPRLPPPGCVSPSSRHSSPAHSTSSGRPAAAIARSALLAAAPADRRSTPPGSREGLLASAGGRRGDLGPQRRQRRSGGDAGPTDPGRQAQDRESRPRVRIFKSENPPPRAARDRAGLTDYERS